MRAVDGDEWTEIRLPKILDYADRISAFWNGSRVIEKLPRASWVLHSIVTTRLVRWSRSRPSRLCENERRRQRKVSR